MNKTLEETVLLPDPFDIYFLEIKNEKQRSEVYSHMKKFKPKWNMMMDAVKNENPTKKIYQLKLELKGFKPKIWRRLLVENTTSFLKLHLIIQAVMDWTNEHMHAFYVDNHEIKGDPVPIFSFLKKEKDHIDYLYDFGDEWRIKITLEKILPFDKKIMLPFCVDGEMAAPPEDSGGVWGYSEDLKELQNPKSEEYEELREWYGEDFDPNKFDKKETNKRLADLLG